MKTIKFAAKSKRKGITPVIAIVLLLMMTVAAAGMAYVWIMSLQEDIAASTNEDLKNLQTQKNARLGIEAVRNNTDATTNPAGNAQGNLAFIVKNAGTYTFSATEVGNIKIYVDGVDVSRDGGNQAELAKIAGQGTSAQIYTGTAFPRTPGSDGGVRIEVVPPVGVGATYLCSKTSVAAAKTC